MTDERDRDALAALSRIAGELEAITVSLQRRDGSAPGRSALGSAGFDTILAAAKAIYRARRLRARYFSELGATFGEPMWDLLLDLFISTREGRRVSTSSACIAADVPPTTALRWLTMMDDEGIVLRESDPHDGRRNYVILAPAGMAAMEAYICDLLADEAASPICALSVARESA